MSCGARIVAVTTPAFRESGWRQGLLRRETDLNLSHDQKSIPAKDGKERSSSWPVNSKRLPVTMQVLKKGDLAKRSPGQSGTVGASIYVRIWRYQSQVCHLGFCRSQCSWLDSRNVSFQTPSAPVSCSLRVQSTEMQGTPGFCLRNRCHGLGLIPGVWHLVPLESREKA